MKKTICELFAGVGGFRLGFNRLKSGWKTVWFNQWEPSATKQWAHACYIKHFSDLKDLTGKYSTNVDISLIDKTTIPDHSLLVGGFPCQDYSVAHSLKTSQGIEGKKGVLWWQIRDVLIAKHPPFCILENVDRLLKSPAKQRGRDFAIMLGCFSQLGYDVEWRVINAAQYGAAQKRKRVFIFAYNNSTKYYKNTNPILPENILSKKGLMSKSFPVLSIGKIQKTKLPRSILKISQNFSFNFQNAGYMTKGIVYTTNVIEKEEQYITLGEILEKNVDKKYFIPKSQINKWKHLKGSKRISRKSSTGHEYVYSEGKMAFPDYLDKPGRTMLTSESTLNRSTHVILDPQVKKLRLITPVEAERLQGFDDNWTNIGMPERMRYFCMGNALVVPMIARMGAVITKIIKNEE